MLRLKTVNHFQYLASSIFNIDKRYQVFVSSTFADLKEERAKVTQALMEIDCIPSGMEIFPAIDQEQFEFIKKVIDDCDYYLLIISGRYGSLSSDGVSYTEMEYDYAVQKNIKIIAFLHGDPDSIPFNKSEPNSEAREKLQTFRNKVATNRLVKYWKNADELPGLVAMNLPKTIKTYPAIGWVRANSIGDASVYQELSTLRKENAELRLALTENIKEKVVFNEGIAGLDDEVTLSGNERIYRRGYGSSSGYHVNTPWSVVVTWGNLFALLAPYLLEKPNDANTKDIVSKQLFLVANPKSSGTVELNDQDFRTIKIHLKTLGLVELSYTKTVGGGMALFWMLTPLGEETLIRLRSVKATKV